jgi:endoglucanase
MRIGINLGRSLELANEGDVNGRVIEQYTFDDIVEAGFDFVRLPVQWDNHTNSDSPYLIEPEWMDRVAEVVDWSLERGLVTIVNSHHDRWILENPDFTEDQLQRFEAIWRQVADRLQGRSDRLVFEIANEPMSLSVAQVDRLNAAVLREIRATNPTRVVVYSGNGYTGLQQMKSAAIPDDPNIMSTFHSYDPWSFAGQGLGTWGSIADRNAVRDRFEDAAAWSDRNDVRVFLGEFGAIGKIEPGLRGRYLETYVFEAIRNGVAVCLWHDFGDFGVYFPSRPKGERWGPVVDVIMAAKETTETSDWELHPVVIERQSDSVSVRWEAAQDQFYRLEYSSDLVEWSAGNWLRLSSGPLGWADASLTAEVSPVHSGQGYFRIRRVDQ